jgi:hypothetical protein
MCSERKKKKKQSDEKYKNMLQWIHELRRGIFPYEIPMLAA